MSDVFSYQGFKETQAQLQQDMIQLENFCENLKMDEIGKGVATILNKSKTDTFNVAILGEFKRGKSTLINGLLGQKVLPADPLPCSATLNRITYGIVPSATIRFKDGSLKSIEVDELEQYVTKLSEESEKTASSIDEAIVSYPLSYCKNNVDIIDTPGLNDDENMTRVTLSVIPDVDVSIFAIMALSPFGQYEKDFLENKLMTSDIGKILFVVTRIDLVDEDDREKVLAHVRRQIEENVMKKAKKVYGENSEQYREYVEKLGDIKVIGISPLQALKGKMKNNEALIESSNYPEFEKELERMLLEDRGAIQLGVQLNRIQSAAAEIIKTIAMYDSCSQMDQAEFDEKYALTMAEIKEMRAKRESELNRLRTNADALKTKLGPMIDEYWNEAEINALDIIDETPITKDDIGSKDRMEQIKEQTIDEISTYLTNSQYILSEKVQHLIEDEVGKQMELLASYETGFVNSVSGLQTSLTTVYSNADVAKDSLFAGMGALGGSVATMVGAATLGSAIIYPAMLASGIVRGYKQAGVKGALAGAAGNFAGGMIGGSVTAAITSGLAAAGIAVAPILAVPIFALGFGLPAVLAGKFAINLVSGSTGKIDEYKKKFKDAISSSFAEQRRGTSLYESYAKQIDEVFKALSDNVYEETEKVLKNTEGILEEMKHQKLENEVLGEQKKAMMSDILVKTQSIAERAKSLNEQLYARIAGES